jgi:hypothetical protein
LSARLLNRLGLIFGLIGAIILFLWGPPQPIFITGVMLTADRGSIIDQKTGKTAEDYAKEVLALRKWHEIASKGGLILIIAAFGCQFIATYVDKHPKRPN